MARNQSDPFINQCVSDILDGLREGLSRYCGPTRVALIYALTPESPLFICDPQALLRGHEPMLRKLYYDRFDWRSAVQVETDKHKFASIVPEDNLHLAGLISQGGRSSSIFYQMWFTEHHPDLCSIGPIECWLEHAVWRLAQDLVADREYYTGISGKFLVEYAMHAVHDYLMDQVNLQLGMDARIHISSILDVVIGISKTREEGAWPVGHLAFIEPGLMDEVEFLVRFHSDEQPQLDNIKHARKLLLAVEYPDHMLVSDGTSILGIARVGKPHFYINAEFCGRHGFLKVNNNRICSFSAGSVNASTHQAKLVQVEETLLESGLDFNTRSSLFAICSRLVHYAERHKFGCTLVVDLNEEPVAISGQTLRTPLDLTQPEPLRLAQSLSRVDGALHIGRDSQLYGFACLLDGPAIPGEDRARGARYNSALRFTARHKNIVVVVVSSDRPVSVIQEGVEVSAQCWWKPVGGTTFNSTRLLDWLEG
jgi:hypothetical protein